MCGVVGVKPTNGLVSRYGGMPRCWSLDVFGSLGRTVRDCAHLLRAVAGHDDRDPTTSAAPVPDYAALLDTPVRGLRVGVPSNHLFPEIDDAVRPALLRSLEVFGSLGVGIIDVAIPDPRPLYDLTNVVNKAEAAALHEKWIRTRRHDYAEAVGSRIDAGFHIPAVRYIEALSLRSRLLAEFVAAVLDKVDALFLPLLTMPVPTLAESELRLS
ncbi:MAG: amidase, partial [Betaproteobacteria bacterium]|nr:amidase [Betaproteobacteria bacterium]